MKSYLTTSIPSSVVQHPAALTSPVVGRPFTNSHRSALGAPRADLHHSSRAVTRQYARVGHVKKAEAYCIGCVGGLDTLAIEEKPNSGGHLALTITESIHELLELCRPLDLEKDLVVVVRHFDVEMLGASVIGWRGAAFVVRHLGIPVISGA